MLTWFIRITAISCLCLSLGCDIQFRTDRSDSSAIDTSSGEEQSSASGDDESNVIPAPLSLSGTAPWDELEISWGGTGTFVVVEADSSSFNWTPTNGTTYTVGQSVGNGGTVKQVGTAKSYSDDDPEVGAQHYFYVYSYNESKEYSRASSLVLNGGLEEVGYFGGKFYGMIYYKNYLLVGTDGASGLMVMTLDDPAYPKILRSFPDIKGHYLASNGDYLYMSSTDGLLVLDASDMTDIKQVGSDNSVSISMQQIHYLGNHIYTDSGSTGIHSFNVSNPTAPAHLGTWIGGYTNIRAVYTSATALYAVSNSDLIVLDTSNPSALGIAGTYTASVPLYSLYVDGNTAYSREVMDVTNAGAISRIGTDSWSNTDVTLADGSNRVYTLNSFFFNSIDITNKSAMNVDVNMGVNGNGACLQLVKVSNHLYGSCALHGIFVMDVTTPSTMSLVRQVAHASAPTGMAIKDNILYVGDVSVNVFNAYDISDPENPQLYSAMANDADKVEAITIAGDFLYVSDDNAGDCKMVDISDPVNPTIVHGHSSSRCYDIDIGNNRWVNATADEMAVYDVTPTFTPGAPDYTNNSSSYYEIAIYQNHVYAARGTGSNEVRIFDTTNLGSVSDLGLSALTCGRDLDVFGDLLLCAHTADTQVYDLTNPAAPSLLIDVDEASAKVDYANGYLISSNADKVWFADLRDQANPYKIDYELSRTDGRTLHGAAIAYQGYLYVGTEAGVRIYKNFAQ